MRIGISLKIACAERPRVWRCAPHMVRPPRPRWPKADFFRCIGQPTASRGMRLVKHQEVKRDRGLAMVPEDQTTLASRQVSLGGKSRGLGLRNSSVQTRHKSDSSVSCWHPPPLPILRQGCAARQTVDAVSPSQQEFRSDTKFTVLRDWTWFFNTERHWNSDMNLFGGGGEKWHRLLRRICK